MDFGWRCQPFKRGSFDLALNLIHRTIKSTDRKAAGVAVRFNTQLAKL